ncbi:MAG: tRNA epoxyqueuosine(34) reductase QueG [Cytophagales bacterium]|nr:tRNA epoxyqueuosine(34) reductase QueG [Cytophagales bacterium]
MLTLASRHTSLIKTLAQEQGFDFCGISKAQFLDEEATHLESWLRRGFHGQMSYMERHADLRLDPTKLVPGARSVISLIYNYFPPDQTLSQHYPKLARYAYGEDYHYVIKDKLNAYFEAIRSQIGQVEGRVFVDSAPVMERQWAARSGLGWLGKNSLLLNRKLGSYFFLAEVICDLELVPDGPVPDYCGTCTRCMDACPTDAIPQPQVVDGSRCISYLTIELKEQIPDSFRGQTRDWVFGCDICQEVCPWNRFAQPHQEPRFAPQPELNEMKISDWLEMTEETFGRVFKKSALKRAKYAGLMRNLKFDPKPTNDE